MGLQPVLLLTTAQDAEIDETCSQKLWYMRFHKGSGLVSNDHVLHDEMLEASLNDMRTIGQMEDLSATAIQQVIDDVLSTLTPADHKDVRSKELLYRRLGWFAAYALFIEPQIRKIYDLLDVPPQVTVQWDNLRILVPTGRLLRHKLSKQIEHREFVHCAVENLRWREQWEYNIRPHLTHRALNDSLEDKVAWTRVCGLQTGFTSSRPAGQLHHPYVYAQYNAQTYEWSHNFKFHDQDGGTWSERPVWEYGGGLTAWVQMCGRDVAERQFPLSPNIPLNTRLVQDWLIARNFRERNIATHKHSGQNNEALRKMHFPRRTTQCMPLYSRPCRFKNLCYSEPFMAQALEIRDFTPRLTAKPPIVTPPPTLSERLESAIEQGRASVVDFLPLHQPLALPAPTVIDIQPSTEEIKP